MKERVRKLRKVLDLTQQQFADKLGLKRNSVANYETGRNTPMDAVITSICREFNVNENWLRNGIGEMFIEISEEDEYMKAAAAISKDNDIEVMSLLVEYWKLDETSKEVFRNYLRDVSDRINASKPKSYYEEALEMSDELENLVVDDLEDDIG